VLRSKQQEDELRNQKPQNTSASKTGSCFLRGIAFFGLFCKMLLRVILTPPARYQHPHDANNSQVGHCGNCKPKLWPQGSTFSSSKTKQRTHKTKRGELNELVVYVDVRIGLTLYSSNCSARYELNLFIGGNKTKFLFKKMSQNVLFRKDTT
jgi:hypothetical protein